MVTAGLRSSEIRKEQFMTYQTGPFAELYEDLKAGRVSRRDFVRKSMSLGIAAPVALFVLNNAPGASAQDATPVTAAGAGAAPSAGTEGQTRGSGGELKLLQWQGVTHFGLHTATGTKDQLGASLVTEPLLHYLPSGELIPCLAAEVPSIENGGLAEDLSSVTYKLKEGILWSDGTPFTADDVVFTWQWAADVANNAITQTTYQGIASAEAIDPLTVKLTFNSPAFGWYVPFSGTYIGSVYPKHVLEAGADAYTAFIQSPVGTGPYVVESFSANDQVIYAVNPNYREANKPFFEKVNLKGGGDAVSAAQAVLDTADWDFAWNLQVEPEILRDLESKGNGKVYSFPPTNVERLLINFSDPNQEVDGQRSEKNTPHPFFSDLKVRQAFSLVTDRDTIANQFYLGGDLEPGAKNIVTGLAAYESPNTSYEFNPDKAAALLDEAGWTKDGDTRKKDGVELKVDYSTTINSVRQKTQALNKQNWEAIGIKVNLKQVDAGIFFDSAAGNEQNAQHFFADLLMYTNGVTSTFPLNYMQSWYSGVDTAVSQKSNSWLGINESRYQSDEYNAMYDRLVVTTSAEEATGLFIAMNDHIINNVVVIAEVARSAELFAAINTLNGENVAGSAFEALYWNIANWNRIA
jgi:peptide/nickel transport system substrate-binding protein